VILLLTNYSMGDKAKDNDVGLACGMYRSEMRGFGG
jgi:hypothetical protein